MTGKFWRVIGGIVAICLIVLLMWLSADFNSVVMGISIGAIGICMLGTLFGGDRHIIGPVLLASAAFVVLSIAFGKS